VSPANLPEPTGAVSVQQSIHPPPPPASFFSATPVSLGPSDGNQGKGSSAPMASQSKAEEHPLLIYSEESLSNIIEKTIYKRK
jgi:hypothetical protein